MKIRNQSGKVMLHTFCKAEDDLEKDTKWMDHEEEVMKTLEDINEHFDPGWKFSKVTVRKNGKMLNILKIWKIWNLRMNKYTETWKREITWRRVESRLGRKINMVNYENYIAADEIFEYDFKSEFKKDFANIVYSGGNTDIDPSKGIVDTGAPRTVAGRIWMEAFAESSQGLDIRRVKEDETYRFGNGPLYRSKEYYVINVDIGELETELKVSVVEADVPLLLGLDFQRKHGVVLDTGKQTLHIKASNQTFNMRGKGNHWKLPIQKTLLHEHAEILVLNVHVDCLDSRNLWKHIQKVHKNLCNKGSGG